MQVHNSYVKLTRLIMMYLLRFKYIMILLKSNILGGKGGQKNVAVHFDQARKKHCKSQPADLGEPKQLSKLKMRVGFR